MIWFYMTLQHPRHMDKLIIFIVLLTIAMQIDRIILASLIQIIQNPSSLIIIYRNCPNRIINIIPTIAVMKINQEPFPSSRQINSAKTIGRIRTNACMLNNYLVSKLFRHICV